ncbi:hypothetical protein K440DRAFT_615447 [Wilcoxina mikolae CBS 423.85]|nr:hypothetical protein K440DRAFT_615447 [Wilcoxina mikolae CBS 423.85]
MGTNEVTPNYLGLATARRDDDDDVLPTYGLCLAFLPLPPPKCFAMPFVDRTIRRPRPPRICVMRRAVRGLPWLSTDESKGRNTILTAAPRSPALPLPKMLTSSFSERSYRCRFLALDRAIKKEKIDPERFIPPSERRHDRRRAWGRPRP